MRAREADQVGSIERAGVKVGYEVFGSGEPTILLLTSWAIVHARQWKFQIPYLARQFRVVAVEGRGNDPGSPAQRLTGRADSAPELGARAGGETHRDQSLEFW
ncbi:MAG TPA: hypothetical protein VHN80_17255 [Kineosporiaceae bacterium]|jgi:hypothetical protein|nr:hypothetical protein [Kineosporiaceae bacterium]